MVYITQNYWVFGLCASSGIPETRKHKVTVTEPVPIKWDGVGDAYSVGSLGKS
jgi:hypothetical protein